MINKKLGIAALAGLLTAGVMAAHPAMANEGKAGCKTDAGQEKQACNGKDKSACEGKDKAACEGKEKAGCDGKEKASCKGE